MKCFSNWLLFSLLLGATLLCGGTTQPRQLRNNRASARIEAVDQPEGEVAVVREVYPRRYPAGGYRPGRAFNLPAEDEGVSEEEVQEGSGLVATSTQSAADLYATKTTTETSVEETTTQNYNWATGELLSDDDAKQGRAVKAPYPPAGWRPNRAFPLPNEVQDSRETDAPSVTQSDSDLMDPFTTSTPTPLAPFTTRLPTFEGVSDFDLTTEPETDSAQEPKAQPSGRKAPYPPSGWRPSRAFLLPTEIEAASQDSKLSVNEPEAPVSPADKAGHPACGVSDNPQSPKPAEDAKENPDAERVYVTANLAPAQLRTPLTMPVLPRSQRLITPPFYMSARRPFAYSATVQSWR